MDYLVIDLETTGLKSFKRFANPLDIRNKIIVHAEKKPAAKPKLLYNKKGLDRNYDIDLENISLLVGQNIKFDLLYLWGNPNVKKYIKEHGQVWDTLTVEYLLSGQRRTKRDLDTLAKKYGGTVKDDQIKLLFKEGIYSDEIDPDLLLPYAAHDVINTEIVFRAQYKLAKRLGMLNIIETYMEHYIATIEMEYNGLYIDQDKLNSRQEQLLSELAEIENKIDTYCQNWSNDEDLKFDPSSQEHISAYLFSGAVKAVKDIPKRDEDGEFLRYKTGKRAGEIKTRKEKVPVKIKGLGVKPRREWKGKKEGFWSVDNKVLSEISSTNTAAKPFIELILTYRGLTKLNSTYYQGFKDLINFNTHCIHPSYNSAVTATGRLSSSNPNGQNIPPEAADLVRSRWNEGLIVSIDYSQLEVCIQAFLTQADKMIQDVKNNVDFHCLRLSYAEKRSYDEVVKLCESSQKWKDKRKKAKVISFQKAYGAHPSMIAESTGLSEEVVRDVFHQEDIRYPEIQEYYSTVTDEISASRIPSNDLINIRVGKGKAAKWVNREGEYKGIGFHQSITGKRYAFREKAVLTKANKIFRYFSGPDIQNYPVQGTAADLVSLQVGQLFKYLKDVPDIKLIAEVHDSVVLDIKSKEIFDSQIENIINKLTNVKETFKERFGIKFNVPILVDYGIGKTWKEAKDDE